MQYHTIIRDKKAVSGVIEALLLIALVAVIIATIQMVYIPQVMNQREAEHMDEVSNQFSYLKSMIDIQTMTESDTPIYSMITLGSRELPYFVTAAAFGSLDIITDDAYRIEVDHVPEATLTSIKYDVNNVYFIDQTYILEGGGIIVDQPDGEPVMRVNPSVSVTGVGEITIHFNLPVFVDIPGKNSTDGHKPGKVLIRTNYSSTNTQPYSSVSSVRIYTNYLNAWNESLSDLLGDDAEVSQGSNYVEISAVDFNVEIREIEIYAQIGPGWLK